MITPKDRREFERNIAMLAEGIQRGRHNFPRDSRVLKSLLNARYLPNKRTNFLTIDEAARLAANSRATFDSAEFKRKYNAQK